MDLGIVGGKKAQETPAQEVPAIRGDKGGKPDIHRQAFSSGSVRLRAQGLNPTDLDPSILLSDLKEIPPLSLTALGIRVLPQGDG
ncbi:hypothetical protein ABTM70_19460, partial [Acinetobacter baumannii]